MGSPHQPTYDSREAATTGAATSTGGQASVLSNENQPGSPGSESVQVEPKAEILADVSILPSCEMNQSDSRSFDGNRELHKAEQFCLQRSGADLSDVLQLIPLLESEQPARGHAASDTFSWTSGAYAKGALRGVRKHTTTFPACARLLCRMVLNVFPAADFSAVAIFRNLRTSLHIDINNEEGSCNYLIPVTKFTGGEVWQQGSGDDVVQDELGNNLLGHFLRVAAGPCTLNPRVTHCTMPWIGERILLVAFKPRHAASLSPSYRQQLLDAGFPAKAFGVCQASPKLCTASSSDGVKQNEHEALPPVADASSIGPTSPVVWKDPLVIELFPGSGRVAACLKQLGLSAVGVDRDPSRSTTTCLPADLSALRDQKLCLEWLSSPRLAGIFATPPHQFCAGLGSFLVRIFRDALNRGVLCVIGQSRVSPFWQSSAWQAVSAHFTFVACQECAYGGSHSAHTVFAVSARCFDKIPRFCSQCCQDVEPATRTHGAYPGRLAMQLACCFAGHFLQCGWPAPPQSFDAFDPRLEVPMSRALAGCQPRASKMPPLVPEHKKVVVLRHPPGLVLPCLPMQRLSKDWPVPLQCASSCSVIPAKAQLLRHVPIGQVGGEMSLKVDVWEMAWGLPWEPEEFMQRAAESDHPRSMGSVLPQPLEEALDSLEDMSVAEVAASRAEVIKEWVHLSVSLSAEEKKLKAAMHPDVRFITEPKRILLWEALLAKYKYPDPAVTNLLKEGVPLVGHAPISGVFKPKFKPMQATPEQVRNDFRVFRKKVHNSLKPQDPSLAAEVFSKTQKELEAGWLVGPLREGELEGGVLVSRRFGLQQGPKVRCIDNLTSSGVNLAVQAYEAPQPQSTDVVASTCLRLLKFVKKRVGKGIFKLLGKAFDLTAAYRQMPVRPDTAWAAYICFVHPETHERVYFKMRAMPFGSSMAVFAFLRLSHSLWFLGAKALLLPWTHFFDDYVTFAATGTSKSAESSVSAMFKLLGWAFAETGDKSHDFAECFQALGIAIDLRSSLDGLIFFRNTEKRVAEIKAFVEKVIETGRLPHHEALRLRGRCQFADSQIFGRTGKKCLGLITEHAYGQHETISHELRNSLERFLIRLGVGAPRLIKLLDGGAWHVYTDASYEPGSGCSFCGLGGVLVDPRGSPQKFFSLVLSEAQKVFLGEKESEQIIFQAEMLALAVALNVWLDELRGCPVVFFVDNNSVRDIAISANAKASIARRLLEDFLQKEHGASIIPWFARVPSPANPADEPSRVDCERMCLRGVTLQRSNVAASVDACLKNVQGLK